MHLLSMKKLFCLCLAVLGCMLVACDPPSDQDFEPTAKEQAMVTEEMTWQLDSIMVITNYQTAKEESYIVYPGEELPRWSFTFYPCTWGFPEDLYFVNAYTEERVYLSREFAQEFCKYVCKSGGEIVGAGYLCYYRDYFTFNGLQSNGMMQFMIREAETDWRTTEVWTCTYNPTEGDDGTVYERNIEFYSRVR